MSDELVQVAEHVWVWPTNPDPAVVQPAVGVVITSAGTVLVDAGNSPRVMRTLALRLLELDAPPVRYVIYTHYHWDHTFGACAFSAPAVAHIECYNRLSEQAGRTWTRAYLEEEVRRNAALQLVYGPMLNAVDDWSSFRIVTPTFAFTNRMALYLGDTRLDLTHVGGQHANDSITVRVDGEGVLFVGDCFYQPPPRYRKPDSTLDYALIERLLADESIHLFVDGHTPGMFPRERVAELLKEQAAR